MHGIKLNTRWSVLQGQGMVDGRKRVKTEGPSERIYLREWREFRGFGSQTDLAKASGITRATISRLESGALPYRKWLLDKLAVTLRCQPADLLSVDPYENANIIQIYNSLSEVKKRALLRKAQELLGER